MVIDDDIKNTTITKLLPRPVRSGEKGHEPKVSNETLPKKVSKEKDALNKIKDVARDILKIEQYMNRGIRIEIEKDLHIVVAKIIDKESGEVIKQVPLPEIIELSKSIKEQLSKMIERQSGILMDKEV